MFLTSRQLFFSHTWKKDRLDRDNHLRVYELAQNLQRCGWSIWIDEENLMGNIDAGMASGIDNADAVIICLTEEYCKKVNESAMNPRKRDNCLKEWTYANARNKLMIPVVMEPILLDINNWPPGIISLYLGSTLYVNGSHNNLYDTAINIHKILLHYNLQPNIFNNKKNNVTTVYTIINSMLFINKFVKKTNNKLTNKNYTLKFLQFNKKVYPLKKHDIRRNSNITSIIHSCNKLYNIDKKWKSTGQLKQISI
uniref:TIR domain-containing protein n=1 Tax=viral metagenome TaxID=1070528 RepID=A0A6C0AXI9_9ZZZZ|tara:strand:+ start:35698 stop:36456 length:759 start_codon:yes stop_codon:yes gene_type:complete